MCVIISASYYSILFLTWFKNVLFLNKKLTNRKIMDYYLVSVLSKDEEIVFITKKLITNWTVFKILDA